MIIKKPIRIVDKRKDAIPKVSFAAGTIKQLLINTNDNQLELLGAIISKGSSSG